MSRPTSGGEMAMNRLPTYNTWNFETLRYSVTSAKDSNNYS